MRGRFLVLAFLAGVASNARCAEPARSGDAASRLLVLKNGEALAGQVTWTGDRYVVSSPGRKLYVGSAEVLFVAADLNDAYRQQAAALAGSDLAGRQSLVAWCLKQGLLDAAAIELDACEKLRNDDPATKLLRQRLVTRREQFATESRNRTPVEAPQVRSPSKSAEDAPRLPSEWADLPDAAVRDFTVKMQPLLVSRCGLSGCHGSASTSTWKLTPVDDVRVHQRRATLINLSATLAQIDRKEPQLSRLLTTPVKPHGSPPTTVLGVKHQSQYATLVRWVSLVCAKPAGARAAVDHETACVGSGRDDVATPGGGAAAFVDPFDPAPFNWRFFPDNPAQQKEVGGSGDPPTTDKDLSTRR